MIRFMLPLLLMCSVASAAPPKIVTPRNEAHLAAMIRGYGGTFGIYGENAGKTVVLQKPYPPELLTVLKSSRDIKQVVARGINDDSFKYFADLPYLQDLSVEPHFDNINETPNKITNEALKTIQNVRLRQLQVAWSEIDDDGLQYLSGQTKLEELDLHDAHITDQGIKHLAGCKSLKRLILTLTRASGVNVPSTVECLAISYPTTEGLTYLKENCPNLKELRLTSATDGGLDYPSTWTPEVAAMVKRDFSKVKIHWPGVR